MFTGSSEDRNTIRELHDTYADAVVRADAEDWTKLWTEDAQWSLMDTTVNGREAVVALWKQAMGALNAISFHCFASAILIDGDRATGRCQTYEILVYKNGTTRAVGGLYEDVMIKHNGVWRYAKRVYRVVAEHNPQGT